MIKISPWTFCLLTVLLVPVSLKGQDESVVEGATTPLISLEANDQQLRDIYARWLTQGAQAALDGGFADLAISLAEQALLANASNFPEVENQVYMILTTAHISNGAIERAKANLNLLKNQSDNAANLRRAIIQFYERDVASAVATLEAIDPLKLNPSDRAWKGLVEALIALSGENLELANNKFQEAKRSAPTRILREQFELLRLRYELRYNKFTSDDINSLRNIVRSFTGERSGFEAARLLSMALFQAGEVDEAVNFLSLQIQQPGIAESGMRPTLLLFIGLFAGENSFQGRLALRQLMSEGGNRDYQGIALTLLAQAPMKGENQEEFLEYLDEWLEASSTSSLKDRLYLYRAFIRSDLMQFSASEEDALQIVNNYSSSPLVIPALRLLSYISWSRVPAQYRTAADYLSRLRDKLPRGLERTRTNRLMADCFFLNGDYLSAAEAYNSVLRDPEVPRQTEVLFQRVLSEIRAGRLDEAKEVLDEYQEEILTNPELYWKAEWNLLDAMKKGGQLNQATTRVETLVQPDRLDQLSPELSYRFRWLRLRLWIELGLVDLALPEALRLLDSLDANTIPEDLFILLRSNFLLLYGEAAYLSGESAKASEIFTQLRSEYPGSGPAILSFLIEARQASSADSLVSAQQSLIQLADAFSESKYAPIALWEAALNAEQRGLNQHLQESIAILERLVTQYPEHELVFYARLKQGDLSRRLNDFATALLIYDRLINSFPAHPERYRAEMSKADCLFVQGGQNANRYEDASVIYERLTLLPETPLNLRLEAAYKLSQTFFQQGQNESRSNILWLIYNERLLQELNLEANTKEVLLSRYWSARILLDLGEIFTNRGEVKQAIDFYQLIINLNLPGQHLAASQIERLSPISST